MTVTLVLQAGVVCAEASDARGKAWGVKSKIRERQICSIEVWREKLVPFILFAMALASSVGRFTGGAVDPVPSQCPDWPRLDFRR